MYRFSFAFLVALLATCAVTASTQGQASPTDLGDADLRGVWSIIELNGTAVREGSENRHPYLTFGEDGYGGSTGCNSFGGIGTLRGDRYYASRASQSAMGCGSLTDQEQAIVGLIAASPRVTR